MSNNTKMGSQAEWRFRIHHSSNWHLRFFLCQFLRQANPRFGFWSLTKLGSNQPPKVKDLVGEASPVQPGLFRFQLPMSSRACVGQDISLAIAMQILS
eukprot:2329958-Amphidinium_carterae.1